MAAPLFPAPLFSIGYERASLDSVIAALKARGVANVLDVRDLPLSSPPPGEASFRHPALPGFPQC